MSLSRAKQVLVANLILWSPTIALAGDPCGEPEDSIFLRIVLSWLPILALIGIWFFFMTRMRASQLKYRELNERKDKHMEKMVELLAEIARQLQRISDPSRSGS